MAMEQERAYLGEEIKELKRELMMARQRIDDERRKYSDIDEILKEVNILEEKGL